MKTSISAIQWMAFMIAGAIAAPIAIADLFHMNPVDTAGFVQRTILVLGIASLLQGLCGHRLPLHEGPAGLWWGVFAIYAGFVGTLYTSETETLRSLTGGMLVSGVFLFILSLFGFIEKLAKLFTPTITFIYLMLLILQLSGSFLRGMFGISEDNPSIQPLIAILSIIVVIITFMLGKSRIIWIKQFSIMFSLILGWILFAVFGKAPAIPQSNSYLELPKIFAFGPPLIDAGMLITSLFLTLLLITNMIASIRVVEAVVAEGKQYQSRYRRAGFISAFNQISGGVFTSIGSVPISGAAGFIKQTGVKSIRPFILGAVLVIFISLMPPLVHFMSALPAPVGYAVTFVIFSKMVGMALTQLGQAENRDHAYMTSGIGLLVGVGVMFLSPEATSTLPVALSSLMNNGLVLGTIIAIIVEQYLKWK